MNGPGDMTDMAKILAKKSAKRALVGAALAASIAGVTLLSTAAPGPLIRCRCR